MQNDPRSICNDTYLYVTNIIWTAGGVCACSVVEHEVFAKGAWKDVTCKPNSKLDISF